MNQPFRTYVDTSVFGGIDDPEFSEDSTAFFQLAKAGRFALHTSPLVEEEVATAPLAVREHFQGLSSEIIVLNITPEAVALRDAYLDADVLSRRWISDAMHVAIASSSGCNIIVSWNFKHIVNLFRVTMYNKVNERHGFPRIGVYSPKEVLSYDEDI